MIRFGSLERDYSLSKGDMTPEKGLRSQLGKDVQLHNSLGSPRPVNELRTISASMCQCNVIAISCKKTWKIHCRQVLHKCVDSCAWFLKQNGLNSQLAIGLGEYSTKQLMKSKYLSGILVLKYPDSFSCFYWVQDTIRTRKVRCDTAVRSNFSHARLHRASGQAAICIKLGKERGIATDIKFIKGLYLIRHPTERMFSHVNTR